MAGAVQTGRRRPRPRPRGRRWRHPRPAGLAAGRLREVRPGRAQGPQPHQEDQRRQPAPQLGADPARHQQRRGRHHRARGLPRPAQQGKREERRQGHDAGLRHQGRGRGAEEVPRLQRQPGRRRSSSTRSTSTSASPPTRRTAWSCRCSRTPTRRACCRSARRWANWPRRRATASSARPT